jgi:hypothetical protein
MVSDVTSPNSEPGIADASLDRDRTASEQALEAAQHNPVLSSDQACAVAQVHALLAIERRLAQLLALLGAGSGPSDRAAAGSALAMLS